jgi:hypothetical protein
MVWLSIDLRDGLALNLCLALNRDLGLALNLGLGLVIVWQNLGLGVYRWLRIGIVNNLQCQIYASGRGTKPKLKHSGHLEPKTLRTLLG